GKGVINRVKVPYLEMKGGDIGSIVQDINRMKVILKNTRSLDAVLDYLENNVRDTSDMQCPNSPIIRTDYYDCDTSTRFQITKTRHTRTGDRAANVAQSMTSGMNEKTIIKQPRDHYATIHPTQKPVRLLERLLALTTKEGDVVLDPFAGSFSTGEACINTGRKFIGIEIDDEYFAGGENRIANILSGNLFNQN
ncbi:MAG: site-specific DNA-methyltransferase, partial [Alistipes sp.]